MTIVRSIPTILFHLDGLTTAVAIGGPAYVLAGLTLGEHTDTGQWSPPMVALTAAAGIIAVLAVIARDVYLRTPGGRRRAANALDVLNAWRTRKGYETIAANLDRIDTDTDKGTR